MKHYLTHIATSRPGRAPTHAAIAHAERQHIYTTHMKPTSNVHSRITCSSMSNFDLGALSRRCHAESAMLSSRSTTRVAIEAACSAGVFLPPLMLSSFLASWKLALTWLTMWSLPFVHRQQRWYNWSRAERLKEHRSREPLTGSCSCLEKEHASWQRPCSFLSAGRLRVDGSEDLCSFARSATCSH